ncbi:MAG: SH3 domain-containing protein [Bryobacterales bacterium]|nr:SH3 domain-containing protein [Bryobacterales bacterium]
MPPTVSSAPCHDESRLTLRVLVLLCPLLLQAQQTLPKLYPIDESSRDGSFQSFVSRLRSAVEARNTKALRKLLDEDIVVGAEKEDQGWRKFVERWKPNDPHTPLWPALADMLQLGFIREQPDLYLSPYVVWRFPQHLDRRLYRVIARDNVPLREAPSLNAPVRARLAFDIVKPTGDPVRSEGLARFVPIETGDGQRGFVSQGDLLSPLLPRAQFAFRQKRWIMVALEGD